MLAGRSAIVTGGAGGLGRAIGARLLADGARVSLWDLGGPALDAAVEALGPGAEGVAVDVTEAEAVAAAAAGVRDRLGGPHVLVANAGILGPVAPLWDQDPAAFRRVLDVNLVGCFLCCRAVVPLMLAMPAAGRHGRIVMMSSIQGKEGMPLSGAYGASKAALIALTKILGKELAGDGILVNCVTPAAVETPMALELTPQRRADITARIPLGRFLEADEVAAMVAWLTSPACSFSTGAAFDLSGGRATY